MRLLFSLLFVSGCFIGQSAHDERVRPFGDFDLDGDGVYDEVRGGDDCDENNPDVGVGLPELCDGIDNNCDGVVDEDLVVTGYIDADGDGRGTGEEVEYCVGDPAYAASSDDCDDSNAAVYLGNEEICDNYDNDCDGTVDNDLTIVWYADTDGDGFGDADNSAELCLGGDGWVSDTSDCDDTLAGVNPDADEVCGDGLDNDCDGDVDSDSPEWIAVYTDADGDGWGDGAATYACGASAGFSDLDGDCNDGDADISPDAEDTCGDDVDNNCNDFVDDGTDWAWYLDEDGDGFGSDGIQVDACFAPGPDWARSNTDCDDTVPAINPDAIEQCNGIDDDCTGVVDDNPPVATWWSDVDGDGFGDLDAPSNLCTPDPATHVQNTQDCDDSKADVSPVGVENCANVGVDNDCDGDDADPPIDPITWHLDDDGDTFGEIGGTTAVACTAPANHVEDDTDCDDGAAAINPGATELCNDVDDNCNGDTDGDATNKTTFSVDTDGDGFGHKTQTVEACDAADGMVVDNTDCDDSVNTIYPDAEEFCNEVDDDCDGEVDEDGATPATWYLDDDGDGFGLLGTTIVDCTQPTDYVLDSRDCDDLRADVNPDMPELCSTVDVDDDCSGVADEAADAIDTTNFYLDGDTDGYGEEGSSPDAQCVAPSGWVADNTDCNDDDEDISPGDQELCATAGVDDNCDGSTDENTAFDAGTWYSDLDDDDYGDPATGEQRCLPSAVQVADDNDCDDGAAAVNPGALELCSTVGIDDNCSGASEEDTADDALTWFLDGDADGSGLTDSTQDACVVPSGYSASDGDCDDSNNTIYPGQTSLACDDATDKNCDTVVDNDGDGDGYSLESCGGTDCDDTDAALNPGLSTCAPPVSCAEQLANVPSSPDGIYTIDPPSSGEIEVYCDMTTDGGGWTLAGRSGAGHGGAGCHQTGGSNFSWKSSRGSVNDDSAAYSLDAEATGIVFDEILIGNRGSGKAWGANVYIQDVPTNLISNYGNSASDSGQVEIVNGSCTPPNNMLRFTGFTNNTDVFWFREDTNGSADFGLGTDGWNLCGGGCDWGVELNGDPGMLMIR